MTSGWQTGSSHIELRWTELTRNAPPDRSWLQDFPAGHEALLAPLVPDLSAHSPLGSGEWMVPWDARWSLPEKR